MKIKFLGATEAEDRIVEVPEGTTTVEVELPEPESNQGNAWPAAAVLIAAMITTIIVTWLLSRG